ncbi:hypothetical protein EVAR_36216_1 [Eumeta japonica]|uniref:Uncharacterized protein n=1 Tax=Eumeta variegata TaxID=151549 RepID=A0A4C1VQS7_EUMVA|nr:hypothetical protein EVAR_36216_1 [Eumeta japonica]
MILDKITTGVITPKRLSWHKLGKNFHIYRVTEEKPLAERDVARYTPLARYPRTKLIALSISPVEFFSRKRDHKLCATRQLKHGHLSAVMRDNCGYVEHSV